MYLVYGIVLGFIVSACWIFMLECSAVVTCKECLALDFLNTIYTLDLSSWTTVISSAVLNYTILISSCSAVIGFIYGLVTFNESNQYDEKVGDNPFISTVVFACVIAFLYFVTCIGWYGLCSSCLGCSI